MKQYPFSAILLLFAFSITNCFAQLIEPPDENDKWDNNLYLSNKFSYGADHWRHSVEVQTRFKDDYTALEQWYVEFVASYLISKKWELIPDFRFTQKPIRREYRPGLGIIRKQIFEEKKVQLVHQFKYQYDIKDGVGNSHGIRYAIFYNKVIKDKLIVTGLAGALFELGNDWSGFLGYRTGITAGYIINKAHSINIGYIYGYINDKTNNYGNIGILSFQLVINISKDYKYLPAKYYSL